MKVKPFTYSAHCPQATAAGGPWDSDREPAWKCQLCRHRTPAQSVPQPLGEAKLHQNDALGSTLSLLLSPRGSPSLLQLTLLGASGSAVPTAALLTLPRTLPWGFTAHHDMRNCSASRAGAWHAVPLLLLVLRQKPPTAGGLGVCNFWPHMDALGFPSGSAGKESACNAGDLGSIPGLRRSPGEGKGYPLQYSGLENSMDCIVHGVTKSQIRLSDFHFHYMDA